MLTVAGAILAVALFAVGILVGMGIRDLFPRGRRS